MAIDDIIGRECIEPGYVTSRARRDEDSRRKSTQRQWERHRARILLTPLSRNESTIDALKFNVRPYALRLRYQLLMMNLEEKLPRVYKTLTSLGFSRNY